MDASNTDSDKGDKGDKSDKSDKSNNLDSVEDPRTEDNTTSDINDALKCSRAREELRGRPMSEWMTLYGLWSRTGCQPHWCGGHSRRIQMHDYRHRYDGIIHVCAIPIKVRTAWKRIYDRMTDFSYRPSDDHYSKQQATAWSLAIRRAENYNPNMSYLPVFLTHVRLYILADK
jgi:hypothetical protein